MSYSTPCSPQKQLRDYLKQWGMKPTFRYAPAVLPAACGCCASSNACPLPSRRPTSQCPLHSRLPARFESVTGRKSKVCYTSLTVTEAQKQAFLKDRPGQVAIAEAAAAAAAEAAAAKGRKKKAGGSGSAPPAAKRARA